MQKINRNYTFNLLSFFIYIFLSLLILLLNLSNNSIIYKIPIYINNASYNIKYAFTDGLVIGYKQFLSQHKLLKSLTEENKKLAYDIELLKAYNLQIDQLKLINKSLYNNINLKKNDDIKYIATFPLAYQSNHSLDNNFIIKFDKATDVEQNTLIISSGYAIGYISKLYNDYANIITIADRNFKMSATTSNTNINVIIQGNGTQTPDIILYANNSIINEEEILLTSGLEGNFPPFVPIGVLIKINNQWKVKLPFNIFELQYVQVVK